LETKIGNLNLDEPFIKSIEKGDESSILQLYDASFSVLMHVAVRYKNNHEDRVSLINNAFMKVIIHIRDFNLGTSYYAWIKTILKREIIDDIRKNKRRMLEVSMADVPDNMESDSVEWDMDREIETKQVEALLQQLPTATRTVFNLFLWEDLRPSEIAHELTISIETVRWHIKMARKLIRQQIEKP
jgi:RNA polymerase sigma-70 factor (ECF subfamily)